MHLWDLHSICYLEKIQTRDQNLETLFKQKIEKKKYRDYSILKQCSLDPTKSKRDF